VPDSSYTVPPSHYRPGWPPGRIIYVILLFSTGGTMASGKESLEPAGFR